MVVVVVVVGGAGGAGGAHVCVSHTLPQFATKSDQLLL
jgi:hypothetical protein